MRLDLQLEMKTSYRSWSPLFSAAKCGKPKLVLMESRTAKYDPIYLKMIVKRREIEGSALEKEAGAGAYDMNKKCILDELKPTASSTMLEKRMTAISRLVK